MARSIPALKRENVIMATHFTADVDMSAKLPINTNDSRRSGNSVLWPYIMRESWRSPVKTLRLELQPKIHHPSKLSTTEKLSTGSWIGGGARPTKGVEFRPATLIDELDGTKKTEVNPQRRSGTKAESDIVQVLRRYRCGDGSHSPGTILREGRYDTKSISIPSQYAARSTSPPDQLAARRGPVSRKRQGDPRSASSGVRSQSATSPLLQAVPSLLHNKNIDYTECPFGCGEEVRVKDLMVHQAHLCSARYVSCLMHGCSTLVQARFLDVHMKRDCSQRRKHCLLADRGNTLNLVMSCRDCGEMLARKSMRAHSVNDCRMRMVQCSNSGCTDMVRASVLQDHERIYCKMVKRFAKIKINSQQDASKPTKECPTCHESVTSREFRNHVAEGCPMRIVDCPNKIQGCGERINAAELGVHLRKQCGVRIDRFERASRHQFRQRRVQCSACGYMVILQHLLRHQNTKCPDRRVPCKHWKVGCRRMLRLSKMDGHLKVDRFLDSRSFLLFDGGRAYIALEEEDRKPPWTVEMWIWRPPVVESTREKARAALKAYLELHRARGKLAATERRLRVLEPLLINAATRASRKGSTEASDTRDILTDEMVAAATLRDNAKVKLVLSVLLVYDRLTSVMRGVEKITAGDRLRGLERLALRTTPWYDVAPNSAECNTSDHGLEREERDRNDELVADPNSALPLVTVLVESENSVRAVVPLIATAAGERVLQPEAGESSVALQRKRWPEEIESGKANELLGIEGRFESIMKEEEVIKKTEEEEYQRTEVAFWAEWVAFSGQSLAKRLLTLAEETLPMLKKEAETITDLTNELFFHAGDEKGKEQQTRRTTDGEGGDNNAIASSGKTDERKKVVRKIKRKKKKEEQFGKKLEKRIAEAAFARGGVESLFGSDKTVFQLEMGPNGQVGIKSSGKKNHIFKYQCPRERWVHLSFVADSGGISLLENGITVSHLPGVNVCLPMREIGGRETACECLVQEVRYWEVKRSKEELVRWMHQVLPSNAVQEGLQGYWTFEEGKGEYVHDITEHRFRARKFGKGLRWCTAENIRIFKLDPPPTPSWREKNACKVELRRGRLAKRGRLHQQLISCSAGCGEGFSTNNIGAQNARCCPT